MHFSQRCSHVIQNEDDSPFKKTAKFLGQQKTTAKTTPSCYKRRLLVVFPLSDSSSNVAKFGHQVTDRDLEIIILR